ncbi:MAG: protein kinase, partial [Phycisphaerales bacterium]|nr:protein kinase [Phycisphaerales bacterium]
DDGRARVADFGLARAGDDAPADAAAATSPGGLTMTGLMIGTPAYMSPEQFRGARNVDARSDQFSFCTVAWECLHGERPFAGDDIATIRAAVLAGRVRQPSPQVRVPGRLSRILLRGLQVDPAARWPAMEALLAELAPPARGRWTAIAGGLAVAAAAGLLAALVVTRDDPAAHCPAGAAERV